MRAMTSPVARPVPRARRPPRLGLVATLVAALVASACVPAAAGPTQPPTPGSSSPAAPQASPPAPTRSPAEIALLVAPPELDQVPGYIAPPPLPGVAPAQPFSMAIGGAADWIQQYTFEWCVGASLQMTANLLHASSDRSRARQQALWEMARDQSSSPFGGANPRGWTAALNDLGLGPYELTSVTDHEEALRTAARALRVTGRPVGLVMWGGRHAWVMNGFTSLGDPVLDPAFRVTGVRVLDPLYPYGDDEWGPSPRPGALVTPETLGRQFVPRGVRRVDLGVGAGYLLVLPVPA